MARNAGARLSSGEKDEDAGLNTPALHKHLPGGEGTRHVVEVAPRICAGHDVSFCYDKTVACIWAENAPILATAGQTTPYIA